MKILIKGAGDIATGIASRLYHCGHQIIMTEIEQPLTVRRLAALSRAVYEKEARVEDLCAVRAGSYAEARELIESGCIAVMVDAQAEVRQTFRPEVIVDAILAKRNLGTKITDAPLVVGVGPGFRAGEDCHCVVETKRGHTLGSLIYEGSALPNTGVPGNVGGYTLERLLRATEDGVIEPCASIGDFVEKGQIVAHTGGCPVFAEMSGILRGMLQEGVRVKKGLKIGDIDARCAVEHCSTISDKARSVGGAVLEAVARFEKWTGRYAMVALAAGSSRRFGGDKLSHPVEGRPIYEHMLEKMEAFPGLERLIVTGNPQIARAAQQRGIQAACNKEPEKGISRSIRIAIEEVTARMPQVEGILFCVCDQPFMRVSTIQKIWNAGIVKPGRIICAGRKGKRGNPVLWSREYFPELLSLEGDNGGRSVMKKYADRIEIVEAARRELKDVDTKQELEELE